jgi:RNA polymerase sigma factor (sigma-70 family)
VVEITDHEIRLAKQGAMSAHRSGRGLVDAGDLIGEANLWMISNMDKLVLWREQGRHGDNKLRNACRQRCLTVIAKERRVRSGAQAGDTQYYTAAMVRELLPDIFDIDDWLTGSAAVSGEVRGPSRPAEGNNRLAMIADIRSAFFGLPVADRELLAQLYQDGGATYDAVANMTEVHERTVRRREERVIEKMVERLGGEPPWKH